METKLDEIETTQTITHVDNLSLIEDERLYNVLVRSVKWSVRQANNPDWYGKESYLVEDIVQTVLQKVWIYLLRDGNAPSLAYLYNYSLQVARHVVADLQRRSHKQSWVIYVDEFDFIQEHGEVGPQDKSSIQKEIASQISRQVILRLCRHLKKNRLIFVAHLLPISKKKHRCKRKMRKSRSFYNLSVDSSRILDC